MTEDRACLACGGTAWMSLPNPGPQSMVSDWRVQPAPLDKAACCQCGLVVRRTRAAGTALFATGYSLYAHEPGAAVEHARQARYAAWIADAVRRHLGDRPPRRVLDVGCGNGSLLLALAPVWPHAELLGCDPSPEAVGHAGASIRAWRGTSRTLGNGLAELVLAVNVVEHTEDPVAFLADLRRACAPGATVIVVCPDGARPGMELLVADHLFSFSAPHLTALAARGGLLAREVIAAPAELGSFQMMAAVVRDGQMPDLGTTVAVRGGADATATTTSLNQQRFALLGRWAGLDRRLASRLPSEVVCFGVGEAAGLLRAYAPTAWRRVRACTADEHAIAPGLSSFGDVPVVPLETLPPETPLVLAVRPAHQATLGMRLAARFRIVHTWYDLVEE